MFVRGDTGWAKADALWRIAEGGRQLDPGLVVLDWSATPGARAVARCRYRDYDRICAPERQGIRGGPERLYLDPKTGFPVKVDRDEPHYLWGQQRVEYVYMSWLRYGGTLMPVTSAKLVDGDEELLREVSGAYAVPADPSLQLARADLQTRSAVTMPVFMRPAPIDTLRLAANVVALRNRGFTELAALSHDTVVVFDATQSEERARSDSAWIGRLFPGHHPVVVVVTDLVTGPTYPASGSGWRAVRPLRRGISRSRFSRLSLIASGSPPDKLEPSKASSGIDAFSAGARFAARGRHPRSIRSTGSGARVRLWHIFPLIACCGQATMSRTRRRPHYMLRRSWPPRAASASFPSAGQLSMYHRSVGPRSPGLRGRPAPPARQHERGPPMRARSVRITLALTLVAATGNAAAAQTVVHVADSSQQTIRLAAAPTVVGPGVISTPAEEFKATVSPDGATLLYVVADHQFRHMTIVESHRTGADWGAPEVATFSGVWRDGDASFAPDGREVVFHLQSSVPQRPDEGCAAQLQHLAYRSARRRHVD